MSVEVVRLSHPATRADIEALPPGIKGEVIDGVLYAMTRPRALHQDLAGAIVEDLRSAFQRGRGGPGGWWILVEPGIELPDAPEVSPDLAGWRRERLPTLPSDSPITVVPDWVCEVLSPRTRRYDQIVKRRYYARVGVAWYWLVDPEAQLVHVNRLENGHWVDAGVFSDETDARLPPFDAIETRLKDWWPEETPAG